MNLAQRISSAAAATLLGAGLTVVAAGASAHAALDTAPSSPAAACQSIGGIYEVSAGDWYCTHPIRSDVADPVLVAVCTGHPYAVIMDDWGPTPTVSFNCWF